MSHPVHVAASQEVLALTSSCIGEVLGPSIAGADLDRSLAELGLESFAAVRLRRRIRERIGADIPIAALLDGATTATVAAEVERRRDDAAKPFPVNQADLTGAPARPSAQRTTSGEFTASERKLTLRAAVVPAGVEPMPALLATCMLLITRWTDAEGFRICAATAPQSTAVELPPPDLLTWRNLGNYSVSLDTILGTTGWEAEMICTAGGPKQPVIRTHLRWLGEDPVIRWDDTGCAIPSDIFEGIRRAHAVLLQRLATDPGSWTALDLCWDPTGVASAPPMPPSAGVGPLLDGPIRTAARRFPERQAVVDPSVVMTHRELAAAATATTAMLHELGVGPGDRVAIACAKGHEQVQAVVGVSASGAEFVPIDPSWPLARVASICARAGVRHALVGPGIAERLPPDVHTHRIGAGDRLIAQFPEVGTHATDAAYTIFTSGSTGTPKGVTIDHRAARATIDDITDRFGVDHEDRVLGLSALSFDLSVYDVFGVLGAGGALVLPDPGQGANPEHWLHLVASEGVTIWNTVPALLEMLVEHAEWAPDQACRALKTLRLVLLSGDWIPVTLPDRLWRLAPQAEIVSLGGATEAAIWSICHPIRMVSPEWPSIPYGRPLRGQVFYVLDGSGRPCRVGETGELHIGGSGLARGYVGDPEQTRTHFAQHPVTGQRLYRTGDLGQWCPDGNIKFIGRVDRQVKVGGHRIELGEIESVLHRLPTVGRCVASVSRTANGREQLVAYVSPRQPGADLDTSELIRVLRDHLPGYMVPARLIPVTHFPITSNGKVDLTQLPNAFTGRGSGIPCR